MPVDLDTAVREVVRDVLPDAPGAALADLGHWRPDGAGRWSSPAPRRLSAAAGMPVALLATRLAAGLTERLGTAAHGGGVEVAGHGFLVVTPGAVDLAAIVATVLGAGTAYGQPVRPVSPVIVNSTLPQRRTPDNRLFVVMWAHARGCGALDRSTAEAGPEGDPVIPRAAEPVTSTERVLILLLADLPRAIAAAGVDPATVLRRLHEVAAATHRWLDELPAPDRRAPGWRTVAEAARQVLANGLDVLGLPAPARL